MATRWNAGCTKLPIKTTSQFIIRRVAGKRVKTLLQISAIDKSIKAKNTKLGIP